MSDFDYDELDKAMNSLSGDEPVANEAQPKSEQPTNDEKPVIDVGEIPERPVVKRPTGGGRFMDVVHPTSAMKLQTTAVTPEPSYPEKPETPAVVQPIPVVSEEPKPVEPEQVPIPVKPEPAVDTTGTDDDSDIEKLSDDINKTLGLADDKALETPFLSDAKVEKRPLGAFSVEQAEQTDSGPVKGDISIDMTTDTPLPAELQNDLLSIESSNVIKAVPAEVPIEKPVETIEKPTESLEQPDEEVSVAPVPKQFHEKAGSVDQKVSPIYDNANSYNKAILAQSNVRAGCG